MYQGPQAFSDGRYDRALAVERCACGQRSGWEGKRVDVRTCEQLNPLLDDLLRMYADSTFGGHFKEQLETIYHMEALIPKSPIQGQFAETKLVIHHWRWIVERTLAWLNNNRRLAKDYERTILSAKNIYLDRPH